MTEEIKDQRVEQAAEPAPKKSKKKLGIAAGVVAAVIVVAGAGFWVWHETPGFCGAICHTPMDPYLATYEAEPGEASIDKWGNEVSDAKAMTASYHRVAGATCLDCHESNLSLQIAEGVSWITGSYEVKANDVYGVVAVERSLDELAEAVGKDGEAICLNDACHNNADGAPMTRDDLAALTADEFGHRNPHVDQHGNTTCSDCHKAHRASVNQCSACHTDALIPEGWISSADSRKLETA